MIPALVALTLAAGGPAPQVFLHAFEVVDRSGVAFEADSPRLQVTLELQGRDDVNFLSARLGHKPAVPGKLVVRGLGYRGSADPVEPRHRNPSFVLDYEEPAMAALIKQVRAELGGAPGIEGLTAYVARYIDKKNLSRPYDVASVVAARKEGDCSEHAVLLAALARAFGTPARVVHGLVLISIGGAVQCFGHAWAEVNDGKVWRPADAALLGAPPRAYLPLMELTDEGVGYLLSGISGPNPRLVRRVVIEQAGP